MRNYKRRKVTFLDLFRSACQKNFKHLTVEELLAVGAWSDFIARGGPDPREG